MDAIHKILVPTDFSPHADEAFRVAHTLARSLGAEVVLFHVAQPPAVVAEGGRLLADPASGMREKHDLDTTCINAIRTLVDGRRTGSELRAPRNAELRRFLSHEPRR